MRWSIDARHLLTSNCRGNEQKINSLTLTTNKSTSEIRLDFDDLCPLDNPSKCLPYDWLQNLNIPYKGMFDIPI